MDHLDEISVGELQDALDSVDGKKPTQRLLAAIAFQHGVSQTELAEWYGVQRRTIYNWLERLDTDEPLEQAVADASRPGRTRKLSPPQRDAFESAVHEPPQSAGFDAQTWTPALAQRYLEETHGVEYSLPSCRRLLEEAGLTYRKPHPATAEEDGNDRENSRGRQGINGGRWEPE